MSSTSAPDSDSRRVEREGAPTAAFISTDRSVIVSSRTDAARHRVAAGSELACVTRRPTRGLEASIVGMQAMVWSKDFAFQTCFSFLLRNRT